VAADPRRHWNGGESLDRFELIEVDELALLMCLIFTAQPDRVVVVEPDLHVTARLSVGPLAGFPNGASTDLPAESTLRSPACSGVMAWIL